MLIERIITAHALGGFFNDDQQAIRSGAVADGDSYRGTPVTPGFASVRMPARVLSIGVVLTDGYVAWGDAMSVQYAGVGGRDPVFDPVRAEEQVRQVVAPALCGRSAESFVVSAYLVGTLRVEGNLLHAGLQYGLTQALLDAASHAAGSFPAQLIAREFSLSLQAKRVPLYAQSGDNRQANIDRMIQKRVEVLPHGLINNAAKFGAAGERFLELVQWTAERAKTLGGENYRPALYFDLYGMAGRTFGNDVAIIADYLARVARAAGQLAITIESPADFGSEAAQLEGFASLRRVLRSRGIAVRIAVDEWCNTLQDIERFGAHQAADVVQIKMPDLGGVQNSIRAVLACRRTGLGALLGGSCTETDVSARLSAHVATATQPEMMLAKPGMGVDEGIMIVGNEQSRILARLAAERGAT